MLHLKISGVHLLLIITQLPPLSHSSSEDTCRHRALAISEHTDEHLLPCLSYKASALCI